MSAPEDTMSEHRTSVTDSAVTDSAVTDSAVTDSAVTDSAVTGSAVTGSAATGRRTTTTIGVLFLSAFALYGAGSLLAAGTTSTAGAGGAPAAGVVLILVNSLAVLAIGILFVPVLARRSPAAATAYLAARIVEAVLLAVGGAALWALAAAQGDPLVGGVLVALNDAAYALGMATLGAGSVVLCVTLLRAALVPRGVALWGAVGYTLFALGSVLELLGITGAGLVLAAPAGLFEVFLGIWLIAVGLGRRGADTTAVAMSTKDR
ncbi:DUF4386 domain-containing protein [Oerskovia sp. NPDC056781]|uniref:DUF4386 domain-containing protein n=1 Tax=Oerskovia sp. NPDC056781 TaxID=3345942 RepID=UPI00366FC5DB